MMRTLTRMVVVMACTLGLAGLAAADEPAPDQVKPVPGEPPAAKAPPADKPVKRPPPAPDAPAADGASAEVKAGTGVVKKEVVGEATSFAKGTKVWAWSKVLGAKGTTVKHVWKRDGAVLWEKELAIGSNQWRIYTRRTVSKAGSYTVDVVGADGAVLGSVSFTVE